MDAQQQEILTKYQVRTSLLEDVKAPGSVTLELVDGNGAVAATVKDALTAESPDAALARIATSPPAAN